MREDILELMNQRMRDLAVEAKKDYPEIVLRAIENEYNRIADSRTIVYEELHKLGVK